MCGAHVTISTSNALEFTTQQRIRRCRPVLARASRLQHPSCSRRPYSSTAHSVSKLSCVSHSKTTAAEEKALNHKLVGDSDWTSFTANWSGEWEGVTATFTADGKPQPLPHLYVPEAFREWGQELFDWQSQCSCKPGASPEDISYVVRRLMPTVGCEADAVASTDQHSHVWRREDLSQWGQLPILPDGSFAAGPAQLDVNSGRVVLEACLVRAAQQDRLRVVVVLAPHWQHKTWQPLTVEVHKEQYDAPYNNGQDLRSCGFRMQPLTPEPALQQADLRQDWAAQPVGVHLKRTSATEPLSPTGTSTPTRWSVDDNSQASFLGLPSGAYCRVECTADNAALWVELGALQEENSVLKSARFVYSNRTLTEVLLGSDVKS